MSLWAGLGYYARARNLHKTAQIISQERQGVFPSDMESMMALPGIGRSTAAAILSLTEDRPFAILDGNVKRVLSRYFCEGNKDALWKIADTLVQPKQAARYTQAMMDIGALICTRSKPKCTICPLMKTCKALQTQQIQHFPPKARVKQKPTEVRDLILAEYDGQILLEKRPNKGIWGGLWALPVLTREQTHQHFTHFTAWPEKQHIFTHFKLRYTPILVRVTPAEMPLQGNWFALEEALALGIPKPVAALLTKTLELRTTHENCLL